MQDSASHPHSPKISRQELAQHCGISLRHVDNLTKRGTLPFYKIGKSVRYDLAEVEQIIRQRFYVRAKQGRGQKGLKA